MHKISYKWAFTSYYNSKSYKEYTYKFPFLSPQANQELSHDN